MNKAAAFSLTIALLAACAAPPPPPMTALSGDDPRPETLLRELRAKAEGRSALRGAMRFVLDSPDMRLRRSQRLAMRRPAFMRFEILGLFNQTAGILVTDGVRYQFFLASSPRVDSGDVTPDLLWRIARVDLSPEEAVDLLLGAPLPHEDLFRAGAWAAPAGGVVIDFEDVRGQLAERFEFGAAGELRSVSSWEPSGAPAWTATFSDYREVDSSRFPFEIEFDFPRMKVHARVDFQSVSLDPELPGDLFAIELDGREIAR